MSWTSICQTEHLPPDMPDPDDNNHHPETLNASDREYGVHVVSQSGDVCKEGSWVFYEKEDMSAFQVCQ